MDGTSGPVQTPSGTLPEIVAHRGNAADFPENTLPAFGSALEAGLSWVELDVQLSADGVPFVIHDITLERTTRRCGDLRRMAAAELMDVDAGEPRRFGAHQRGVRMPRLDEFAGLLSRYPAACAFIEIKRASLAHRGRETCLERILDALAPVADRCIMISFDAPVVAMARAGNGRPIGWVIERFDRTALDQLAALEPDFVFYDYLKLPDDAPLPAGPWRWAAYEVKTPARAMIEAGRGATLVETMAPLRLQAGLAAAIGSR